MELPKNYDHVNPRFISAHDKGRTLEKKLMLDIADTKKTTSEISNYQGYLVNVRICGHLLSIAPNDTAKAEIYREIVSAATDQALIDLGEMYLKHFIRPSRRSKGRTPTPSEHPSRPSFDTTQQEIFATLKEVPQNHAHAKASALVRDGFRCMLTGILDQQSVERYSEAKSLWKSLGKPVAHETQCCYIFAESTNSGFNDPDKKEFAATAWTIIHRFGHPNIRDEIQKNVHSLKNILTLTTTLHNKFDDLKLWFESSESTTQTNEHTVCVRDEELRDLYGIPTTVQFRSHRDGLELPSKWYLDLHAVCCKLAKMSGAAGYLDQLDEDRDRYDFVPPDESFAGALAARLHDLGGTAPSALLEIRYYSHSSNSRYRKVEVSRSDLEVAIEDDWIEEGCMCRLGHSRVEAREGESFEDLTELQRKLGSASPSLPVVRCLVRVWLVTSQRCN
ncbi:hypothetical protein EIP91_002517 [Steccherinum ochraceum]|uniref:Uncharacterized protein n=1 Tax=Steccherinum ochraceum TaxID=92696 RepID=A0A4R0RFP8_9APHY|nr:hypothetical protein EIP91_002517 [Steccherinum ochraceum]